MTHEKTDDIQYPAIRPKRSGRGDLIDVQRYDSEEPAEVGE